MVAGRHSREAAGEPCVCSTATDIAATIENNGSSNSSLHAGVLGALSEVLFGVFREYKKEGRAVALFAINTDTSIVTSDD